jgi:3-oxoacyl-[acyl-carrier protein] reductase
VPAFRTFEDIQIGDTAVLTRRIGEDDIRRFVEMTGDDNPLHVNRAYAEKTPFKDIVVHGMLGASFISTIIGTKLPGEGALWMAQSLEFLLPVRLGDELTVTATVTKKHERDRLLELDTRITNQSAQVVLQGTGKVRLLEQRPEPPKEEGAGLLVALVTGGSGGIGRAICERLAADGFKVAVHFRSNAAAANAVVERIGSKGGTAQAFGADLTDPEQVKALVARVVSAFGGVDVLVNNASPHIVAKPFDLLSWNDFDGHFRAQVGAAFFLCQEVVPRMKTRKQGRIINITSMVADGTPTPQWTTYAVAKSALATFTRALAVELGPSGIRVNNVAPGMTDTALVGDIPEKARLIVAQQTPLRRLADPTDVAGAVSFLASPSSSFMTGETVRVNGGKAML